MQRRTGKKMYTRVPSFPPICTTFESTNKHKKIRIGGFRKNGNHGLGKWEILGVIWMLGETKIYTYVGWHVRRKSHAWVVGER